MNIFIHWLQNREKIGPLVESCAVAHYHRVFPTFYIKAKGEVDIAYVQGRRFWPGEVKWTRQIRPQQLTQIVKYDNGLILTSARKPGRMQGLPTLPLAVALLKIAALK